MATTRPTTVLVGTGLGNIGRNRRQGRKVTGEPGRVCRAEECSTVLSRYNGGVLCATHAPLTFGRVRGVKS